MSTGPAVTMQELELETAELLPARETLSSSARAGSGNTGQSGLVNVSAANGSFNNVVSAGGHHSPGGSGGDGNTEQTGLVNVSAANGSFNNVVSAGSGNTG
jgi:hypothetical protein